MVLFFLFFESSMHDAKTIAYVMSSALLFCIYACFLMEEILLLSTSDSHVVNYEVILEKENAIRKN